MSSFFNLFTYKLGLPIDPFYSFLIMVVVGEIACRAAFSLVGDFYDNNLLQSSAGGSICHWFIRALVYIIIWAVLYALISVGKFVFHNWKVILLISGCILATVIVVTVIAIVRRKKHERKAD